MDNMRLMIFREMASSSASRNEYIRQIKLTYGEDAVLEALRVYDNVKPENVPHERQREVGSGLDNRITINLSLVAPILGKYQASVGQLILIVDTILFLLLFFFPPFVVTLSNGATTSLGYHLIFMPPIYEHVTVQPMSYAKLIGRIDVATLLVEWSFVGIISFLVWKYFARGKGIPQVQVIKWGEPKVEENGDEIQAPVKSPNLVGKRFLIALSWFFLFVTVANIGLMKAGGQTVPWNHEFFFSLLCGTLLAIYAPSARIFAFIGGFLLSFPLLALIGRLGRFLGQG